LKILVDADACPVKEIIVRIAKKYNIDIIMFIDTSHILNSCDYEVITVDKARDSVDIALINKVNKGDIVISQDYGVAAMALAKNAFALSQNGLVYSNDNIDKLLFERHLSQKSRKSKIRTKGPRKRTKDDDIFFENIFNELINRINK